MFKEKLVLTFYAQTPVHMGSGSAVSSYVDNPVQREKHTDYPMLASSGIKGVIRDLAERIWNDKNKVNTIFGPEDGSEEYASCISFTDAKILLFPVRSVKGVFAYITCPYVLKRFENELKSLGVKDVNFNVSEIDEEKVIITSDSNSVLKIDNNHVALEEFVFNIDGSQNANDIAKEIEKYLPEGIIRDDFQKRFAIVSDDVFRDFVKYAVEIRTRIRIDQTTGTVAKGALFTIELVPAEAVFYGFLFIADPYNKSQSELTDASSVKSKMKELFEKYSIIQLGGDETLGMGLMRVWNPDIETQSQNQQQTQPQGGNK